MSAELESYSDIEHSLEGLVGAVSGLLGQSARMPVDARVAEIPDARTLRFYQTIGVLDKPLRYDGRRAVYGYRHLLQALGIKLLQGQGYSLAQIQQLLSEMDGNELEQLVVEVLGERQSVPGPPPPVSGAGRMRMTSQGKTLIATDLGQGISVILDPVQVQNPEIVLVAMRELLNAIKEEI